MSIFKGKRKNENGFIVVDVKQLIDWNEPNGEGCIVSDMITKEGWKVGYMFRDEPLSGRPDSGWHFFKGDEDDEYSNNPANHHIFAINTICNYYPDIFVDGMLSIKETQLKYRDKIFVGICGVRGR